MDSEDVSTPSAPASRRSTGGTSQRRGGKAVVVVADTNIDDNTHVGTNTHVIKSENNDIHDNNDVDDDHDEALRALGSLDDLSSLPTAFLRLADFWRRVLRVLGQRVAEARLWAAVFAQLRKEGAARCSPRSVAVLCEWAEARKIQLSEM